LFRRLPFLGFAVDAVLAKAAQMAKSRSSWSARPVVMSASARLAWRVPLPSPEGAGAVLLGRSGQCQRASPRRRGSSPRLVAPLPQQCLDTVAGGRDRLLDVGDLAAQRPDVELLLDQAGPLVLLRRVLPRSLAGAAGERP
jgi:hypothetical protein